MVLSVTHGTLLQLSISLPVVSQLLVNGTTLAARYILVAMGLNLVLGILDIADFAQGTLYLLAAYLLYTMTTIFGIPFWASAIISVVAVGGLGMLNFLLIYRQLLDEPPVSNFLAAFGLFSVFQGIVFFRFGPDFRSIPTPVSGSFKVAGLFINKMQFISLIVSVIVVILTFWVIDRTHIGKSIRAVAQNREKAELLGIRSTRIYLLTFLIASLLSGIAGVMIAPVFTLHPFIAMTTIVKGFIVAVLGGLGSIRGAVAGGLFLGTIESISLLYLSNEIANAIGFLILFVVLVVRPQGIFGSRGAAA